MLFYPLPYALIVSQIKLLMLYNAPLGSGGKAVYFLALYGNESSALHSVFFFSEHVAPCTAECSVKLFQILQLLSTHLIDVKVISLPHRRHTAFKSIFMG